MVQTKTTRAKRPVVASPLPLRRGSCGGMNDREYRSNTAFEWLVSRVEYSERTAAEGALVALATYKFNSKLTRQVEQALTKRGDPGLQRIFKELWN